VSVVARSRSRTGKIGAVRALSAMVGLVVTLGASSARSQATLPPEILPPPPQAVGFDQNIGATLPLDAAFKDETGKSVHLGDYFGKKPVVLTFAYFTCPMLCGLALQGMVGSLKGMNLEAGRDFEVVTVSFEPKDTPEQARAKKDTMVSRYGRKGTEGAFHFLTGDQSTIDRITKIAGFRYEWDAKEQQYAHATGIMVATPQGQIARYLFGVEYIPRDLRFSLVEASQGKLGSVVDQLLLLCYHYDPKAGRYGAFAIGSMRTAGAVTLLALGALVIVISRKPKNDSSDAGGA
jgi:protein SCO1/2